MVKPTGIEGHRGVASRERGQQVQQADAPAGTAAGQAPPPLPVVAADGFGSSGGQAEYPSGGVGDRGGRASSLVAVRLPPKRAANRKRVLVLNSGSSSIKLKVMREGERAHISGKLERIGEAQSKLTLKVGDTEHVIAQPVRDHAEALQLIVEALTDERVGGLDVADIGAVGHRVVHGGEAFTQPVRITAEVEAAIEENARLAPLHNPPALAGIAAVRALFGDKVPQVAVFDTAFHATMSEEASAYALPKAWRDEGVRRYGFHGISVENATERAAKLLGRPKRRTNLVVCHLGNGASITAVKDGRSLDTSMGMTPLAGITMGTRPGDVDVGAVFHMAKRGMTLAEIESDLNHKSGLYGLSDGLSNDVRELLAAEERGDARARLALDKYVEDIVEQMGAFIAKLKGDVHAVVLTGGVGENSAVMRARILEHFEAFGFRLDKKRNAEKVGDEADLSRKGDERRVLVVRADEEAAIAQHTFRLTRPRRKR